ncbi:hypothetical protein NP233_g3554 [Leucocoprinus birnbaumii]|uniref:Uncharacterized protein n=1 Tax=Leucocoprinus birnbaumii TaxID=56174 RepID=A0AAD5VWY9_9AGAR|nr:hypothetical protein NP233_g3554 [Leucocoprinus birnbaumii]
MMFHKMKRAFLQSVEFFSTARGMAITHSVITIACNGNLLYSPARAVLEGLKMCDEVIQSELSLPVKIVQPEMGVLLAPAWNDMPKTNAMTERRVDLGMMIYRLEAMQTPQGRQTLDALKRFDDYAKRAIDLIDTFTATAKRISRTLLLNLGSLIDTFNRTSGIPKYSAALYQLVVFEQTRIDVWVRNFQRDLKELYELITAVQNALDDGDKTVTQIFSAAGVAAADMEKYLSGKLSVDMEQSLLSRVFAEADTNEVQEIAKRAIMDFDELRKANAEARRIVGEMSRQVKEVMDGIKAAYRSADEIFVVNMGTDELVSKTLDTLKQLEKSLESTMNRDKYCIVSTGCSHNP